MKKKGDACVRDFLLQQLTICSGASGYAVLTQPIAKTAGMHLEKRVPACSVYLAHSCICWPRSLKHDSVNRVSLNYTSAECAMLLSTAECLGWPAGLANQLEMGEASPFFLCPPSHWPQSSRDDCKSRVAPHHWLSKRELPSRLDALGFGSFVTNARRRAQIQVLAFRRSGFSGRSC